MSLAQIAASEWSFVFGTALGCLLVTIFIVTMQRKLSGLRTDFKLLLDEVSHLKLAEERRFMREINTQKKKKPGQTSSETPQTAAPPVVPAHPDSSRGEQQ